MGTSALFKRQNDFKFNLSDLTKEELKEIDKLSPWMMIKEGSGAGASNWNSITAIFIP